MPPKTKFPGTPPKEAIEYFDSKGLEIGFDFADVWKEEHLASFTVAKIMEADVLADMRALVQGALEDGIGFHEFQRTARMLLDRSGWSDYNKNTPEKHRLRIIYDTNMRTARAVGQWQRIERTKTLLPFLVYELGPSVRHREWHEAWEGTTLPIDDQWWDDHATPNGFL